MLSGSSSGQVLQECEDAKRNKTEETDRETDLSNIRDGGNFQRMMPESLM